MKILYKFPSRSRPLKFINGLDNIFINQLHEDFLVMATLDTDDTTMNNIDIKEKMSFYDRLYPIFGKSHSKIHAVNRDMELAPEWDILVVMSDDMVFVEKGFDKKIISDMEDYFPDLDGVLHYNDGNQKANVMTMSIMGKKYYDRQGYIYNPLYQSLWCDVEETEKAYMLGKYKYMGDSKIIFKHFHPAWNLAEWDEQYRATESPKFWKEDREVIDSRRAINYGLGETKNGLLYNKL
jgi:hypothetical protein